MANTLRKSHFIWFDNLTVKQRGYEGLFKVFGDSLRHHILEVISKFPHFVWFRHA
ncbi:uncharacterized protein METZ01_LOCUS210385, partial [marine metagenome]